MLKAQKEFKLLLFGLFILVLLNKAVDKQLLMQMNEYLQNSYKYKLTQTPFCVETWCQVPVDLCYSFY